MKLKLLGAALLMVAGLGTAQARTDVYVGIGNGVYYGAPYPTYHRPPPPPPPRYGYYDGPYYSPPPRVVYERYVYRAPPPRYYYRDDYRGRGHGHSHHRH